MISRDDRTGLYVTAIFHLAVVIILLVVQIGHTIGRETSFVLDFTRQDELERLEELEKLRSDALSRLEDMIAAQSSAGAAPIRNVTVNAGALKDDRGTDAEQLYREAERLAKDLKDGPSPSGKEQEEYVVAEDKTDGRKPEKTYSGPSVLSWTLDGRKAGRLPIPAYRCIGSGTVTVLITVNRKGEVTAAKVQEEVSTGDGCLRDFALRAARLSRFSASQTAPEKQPGNIVYSFIAQ